MRKRIVVISLIVLSLSIFSGCEAILKLFGIDTAAPQIASVFPSDGSSNVDIDVKIVVTYSEPMDTTATTAAFTMVPSVLGEGAWSSDNTVFTFTPNSELASATEYSATITTQAKDPAGDAIEDPFVWSFTTMMGLDYRWAHVVGGIEDDSGVSLAVDPGNNIYIGGYFNGTVDFDPSNGDDIQTEITGPNGDYFLTRINSDGSYGWTRIIPSNDRYGGSKSVAVDSNSNVYLTGSDTSRDMIVNKYTSGGVLEWVKTVQGDGYAVKGQAVRADSSGNVYIVGSFYGTADFDPGAGVDNKISEGESDVFVTKLNSDGAYGWTKTAGGDSYDFGGSVDIDGNNDIYLAGSFRGTVDFDPGPGVDNKTSSGLDDIFITKITSGGNYAWTKTLQSTGGDDETKCIGTDSANSIYVTGAFYSNMDFDPGSGTDNRSPNGSGDIFITKLMSDGTYSWTRTIGGVGSDMGWSIAVDSDDNVYLTGTFSGTVDFDPSGANDSLSSNGDWDIFIAKLFPDGSYGGTFAMGSASGEGDIGNAIAVDSNDNVFATGRFFQTVDFDPGVGVDNRTSAGDCDVFVVKYGIAR